MAKQKRQGSGGTARPTALKSTPGSSARKAAPKAAPESVQSLRAERDSLRVRLAAAEARVADLEARQGALLDRIDWTIDSLSTLAEMGFTGKRLGASNSRN